MIRLKDVLIEDFDENENIFNYDGSFERIDSR